MLNADHLLGRVAFYSSAVATAAVAAFLVSQASLRSVSAVTELAATTSTLERLRDEEANWRRIRVRASCETDFSDPVSCNRSTRAKDTIVPLPRKRPSTAPSASAVDSEVHQRLDSQANEISKLRTEMLAVATALDSAKRTDWIALLTAMLAAFFSGISGCAAILNYRLARKREMTAARAGTEPSNAETIPAR